ncbi:probable glycosyltransferase 3 [Lolium rigidum]|uniref:probable glycosyltransferase 3 n=1 Tax=Lolium rigidum TaxID=89674 RepID=UPI001F5CEBC9|nr:probable glycosyltransferase 3 [Lolium rigidum]
MAVAGGLGRPGRPTRGNKQMQKTINNVKITVICGFITILVLRGTVGIDFLSFGGGGGGEAAADAQVFEDIERILREIRSDSEPDEDDQLAGAASGNSSTAVRVEEVMRNYTLGPSITRWNAQRRQWMSQNPGFPSRDALGKPKILLVTGSPPGPCDNPAGDHYLLKSTKNKIDYCRIHGIEIVHNMAHLDRELSGYWSKLPLLRRLMLSHPEVEWVWWMDSDAIFTDMAFELPLARYVASNLVIHGYEDLLWKQRSWIALNTGSFLLRNCQWSMELLDAWAPMGPKGSVREAAGKVLTASLTGRPAFEADDQSALIHLLLTQKERWMEKVYVENKYFLHGFWAGLVDRYEEMMEKHHPGLGDERWPFVTHFVGCKPCGSYGDYPVEQCLGGMERAFNFADNQVLRLYGFRHRSLASPKVKSVANRTATPLEAKEAALNMTTKIET